MFNMDRLAAFVRALASPRLTVAFFLLMAAAVLAVVYGAVVPTPAVLAPLALLVVNLSASIATNARFRSDLPLLVFHISLLAFISLLAIARLTYFEGTAVVPVGVWFGGDLRTDERGPLHGAGARRLRFSNDGFTEVVSEKNTSQYIYNRVKFLDGAGNSHQGVIGNDRPLALDGYRIYVSRNRGFAPTLQWLADDEAVHFTTVQLEPIGVDGFTMGTAWTIPGGPPLWVSLSTELPQPTASARRDNLGIKDADNKLMVWHNGRFTDLRLGQSMDLPGGRLTYSGLNVWIGYNISYDPTRPWLIGTIAIAIISLMCFYARQLWRTWDEN